MYTKNEFSTEANGLPELVLYSSLVEAGVLELYDGALQMTWRYDPRPLDNEAPDDRVHIDEQIAKSLNLGSSWCVEANMIRRSVTDYLSRQTDIPAVGQLIDEERRLQFLTPGYYFGSQYYLTLTYLPPSLREQRIEGWLTGEQAGDHSVRARHLQTFFEKVSNFESSFRSQLSLHRLGPQQVDGSWYDDSLSFLWECVFGRQRRFALPRVPLYLNQRFTGQFIGGRTPALDGRHIRVIAVDAYPAGSWPGVFTALERLPFPYRYHQRAILFHPDVSKKMHLKNEKAWRRASRSYTSKLMGSQGNVDPDALAM
jgi:type IV secretion system protein TrbE